MFPACSQLTVADLVYMDGAIFVLLAIARESLPGKNDAVLWRLNVPYDIRCL
jgi:hypothetical protein